MQSNDVPPSEADDPIRKANSAFYEKAKLAFKKLFDLAKAKNELHFAFSLAPEFRGLRDAGWNTALEAQIAFQQYLEFMRANPDDAFKARVALAFYSHLAEASGFYEVPKNMLRVAGGERYKAWPFQKLVEKHKLTGAVIAPNANKVLRDLVGHAQGLGLVELAEVFRDAFDGDVRNGYAHADYVVWEDGIRLPKRNGGQPRKIAWLEFNGLLERGINFFHLLNETIAEYRAGYSPAKQIRGRLADEPEGTWTIYADLENKRFRISG